MSYSWVYSRTISVTHWFSPLSVIGRGGEQINKLQSETGAKIQVAPGKGSVIFHWSENAGLNLNL